MTAREVQLRQQEMHEYMASTVDSAFIQEYANRIGLMAEFPDLRAPAKGPTPAEIKAEKLLVKNLSAEQKKDWLANRTFMVTGNTTGIQYRLTKSRTYGIETYLYGRKIGRLCVVAKDPKIPIYDQLLAQKLLIETDEKAFVALANVSA
jgi:hypothetical protein